MASQGDDQVDARDQLIGRLEEHTPREMRERKRWLLWRLEEVEGREGLQKVPYWISGEKRRGTHGAEEDLRKLATFTDALRRFRQSSRYAGVGFAFLAGDGLIAIDLDDTVGDEGEIRENHHEIIQACASYTERSPSGRGVHIICTGDADSFKHDPAGVEVYSRDRYFTVTGDHWSGSPPQVQPLQAFALKLLQMVVQQSKDAVRAAKQAAAAPATAPSRQAERVDGVGQGGNDFKRVNEAAYRCLDAWVPQVLPKARRWHDGYRITSKELGRDLQEDLQLDPKMIWDFGEEHGMSPIDVVMKWGPAHDLKGALHWLAPIVGVQLAERKRNLRLVRPDPPQAAANDPRPEPPPPPSEGGTESAPETGTAKGGKGGKGGKRSKPPTGGEGDKSQRLMEHYALIRGTDSVWDGEERTVMQVKNLRLLFGTTTVNEWLADRNRQLLRPEQIRFEPGTEFTDGSVNLFDKLPTDPEECTPEEVAPILELLRHLCSLSHPTPEGCEAVFDQVLKWCALMVQQPGAKLRFALVFHGPQGAGKNMFFDTFRRIFGKYGKMVGQAELEDRFNGYMSGKLLLIANEVMTRAELFHQKNKLKWVITEDEIPIRGMHQETRWESNHANVVFLSNETQPLALEKDDRRHLVVYTPAAEDRDLYLRCADFNARGGVAKFMHYLSRVDLDGFNEYTQPLMTEAKEELIALGLKPPERFVEEWLRGYLDLPVRVCSAEQLFRVYRRWSDQSNVRFAGDRGTFTNTVKRYVFEKRERDKDGKKLDPALTYKVIQLKEPEGARHAVRCWIPRGCQPPNGVSEGEWAWPSVQAFEPCVHGFGRVHIEQEDA